MKFYYYNMDIIKSKVINIKTEILYRSAEDDLFYFNKINSAYNKLKEAVLLTPHHLKSIILLADITFIKGFIQKALDLYLKAEKLNANNPKILAALANCFSMLGDYSNAILYCNKAIFLFNKENYALLEQVFEIKLKILMLQKEYNLAYETLKNAKKILNIPSVKSGYDLTYKILNKKINRQKIKKSKLKIV